MESLLTPLLRMLKNQRQQKKCGVGVRRQLVSRDSVIPAGAESPTRFFERYSNHERKQIIRWKPRVSNDGKRPAGLLRAGWNGHFGEPDVG